MDLAGIGHHLLFALSVAALSLGLVFVLVGFGAQGIVNGRTLYLVGATTDTQRPFCLAVANVVTGVVAIGLGSLAGALASLQGVAWPIGMMIILNIVTVVFALRLKDIHPNAGAANAASSTLRP